MKQKVVDGRNQLALGPAERRTRVSGHDGDGTAASVQEFWQVGLRFSRRRRGFVRRRRLPSVTQAFLDLSLGAYLRQHLLDQVTRKRKPRVARALVRGRAGEMFDLGADRLLETLQIGVEPGCSARSAPISLIRCSSAANAAVAASGRAAPTSSTVPLGALPVGEAALVVEASLSPGSAVVLPDSAMMVFLQQQRERRTLSSTILPFSTNSSRFQCPSSASGGACFPPASAFSAWDRPCRCNRVPPRPCGTHSRIWRRPRQP